VLLRLHFGVCNVHSGPVRAERVQGEFVLTVVDALVYFILEFLFKRLLDHKVRDFVVD